MEKERGESGIALFFGAGFEGVVVVVGGDNVGKGWLNVRKLEL